ncbi:hypothetical protein IFM12275_22060 [Nocardia sputorum]|nr:hypothetical protein IFM12275_22060 [Nocardia sputorum]
MLTSFFRAVGKERSERGHSSHTRRLRLRRGLFAEVPVPRRHAHRRQNGSGSGQRRDALCRMSGPWWRHHELGPAEAARGQGRGADGDAVCWMGRGDDRAAEFVREHLGDLRRPGRPAYQQDSVDIRSGQSRGPDALVQQRYR